MTGMKHNQKKKRIHCNTLVHENLKTSQEQSKKGKKKQSRYLVSKNKTLCYQLQVFKFVYFNKVHA